MAIKATRGLPSFQEMFQAFSNRGNLAGAVKAGFEGFDKGQAQVAAGKEAESEASLRAAQALKARADAERLGKEDPQDRVPLISLGPEAQAALGSFQDAEGKVPRSTANVFLQQTKQGAAITQAGEELTQRQKEFKERQTIAQQLADVKEKNAELAQRNRELESGVEAATALTTAAGKVPAPGLAARLGSVVGIKSPSITAQEEGARGRGALSDAVQRSAAITALRQAGEQVTEANIAEVIRQQQAQ